MKKTLHAETVAEIIREDARYTVEAYQFVSEALDFTVKTLHKGPGRHVAAAELLEGVRLYALREYGAMTLTVLGSWGIRRGEDIGQIVFNLVNKSVFWKTEDDSIHDFDNGYDFATVFSKPFEPDARQRTTIASGGDVAKR